jgi:hypothetical protein
MIDAMIFSAGLATAFAAHQVADHGLGQSDYQAANKGKPGWLGWKALLGHVFDYHLVMLFMLLATIMVLDLPVTFMGFMLFMAFSAVTHAFFDRRWPVKWFLEHTGSSDFSKMTTPLCGMYLADQGLHYLCLWVSALLLTVG